MRKQTKLAETFPIENIDTYPFEVLTQITQSRDSQQIEWSNFVRHSVLLKVSSKITATQRTTWSMTEVSNKILRFYFMSCMNTNTLCGVGWLYIQLFHTNIVNTILS